MTTKTFEIASLKRQIASMQIEYQQQLDDKDARIVELLDGIVSLHDRLAAVAVERDDLQVELNRQLTAENRVVAVVLSDHAGKPLHATI